jgi:uncharacterized membrane protein YhaH (DUF805 family)
MHKTISLSSHALCAALLLEKSLMVTTHFFPFYVLKTFTPELVLEKAARRWRPPSRSPVWKLFIKPACPAYMVGKGTHQNTAAKKGEKGKEDKE